MKSVNFENDCVVLRSPATDPDLRAFARLWPDDVSLSKFLIRVTEAKGLDPKERDRLVRAPSLLLPLHFFGSLTSIVRSLN